MTDHNQPSTTLNIALAGATGYLGKHLAHELHARGHQVTAFVRHAQTRQCDFPATRVVDVDVSDVSSETTLEAALQDVDVVISTVGITRQRDGLTYEDVDYGANMRLLEAAKRAGVKKFAYVSALNGDKLRHLKIFQAKEAFVDALKASGLAYIVVRPNGFFSDLAEIFTMAQQGRVFLFGDGSKRLNPIHGADLASVCVDMLAETNLEVDVGGSEILSQREIAARAFAVLGKPVRITYLPDWTRQIMLWAVRTFTSVKTYGPIEFFLTTLALDMLAPQHGSRTLQAFFATLAEPQQQPSNKTVSQA